MTDFSKGGTQWETKAGKEQGEGPETEGKQTGTTSKTEAGQTTQSALKKGGGFQWLQDSTNNVLVPETNRKNVIIEAVTKKRDEPCKREISLKSLS